MGEFRIRSGETTYPSPLQKQAGEGEWPGLGELEPQRHEGWGGETHSSPPRNGMSN